MCSAICLPRGAWCNILRCLPPRSNRFAVRICGINASHRIRNPLPKCSYSWTILLILLISSRSERNYSKFKTVIQQVPRNKSEAAHRLKAPSPHHVNGDRREATRPEYFPIFILYFSYMLLWTCPWFSFDLRMGARFVVRRCLGPCADITIIIKSYNKVWVCRRHL